MNFRDIFKRRPDAEKTDTPVLGTAPATKIRLLQNIVEGGGVKLSRRRKQSDGSYGVDIAWCKDAVIEVSQATGQKYVDDGKAVWVRP